MKHANTTTSNLKNTVKQRFSVNRCCDFTMGSSHSTRGFTFFELLVVMMIMITVLGMMAPNLRKFFFAHHTNEKAQHMLALIRHGRSQAVTQGIVHRLTLNLQDHEYILEKQIEGKYVNLGNSIGKTFDWPDNMEVTFEADDDQTDPIELIFTSQGTITPGKIILKDKYEKGYVLKSLTRSEPYVLQTLAEDEASDE